ncbi:MAG TPA: VOC family protein [Vicinamibacterales bacterium]|nr:VOC family protein [Vicinamibacterales bacterium]
MKLTALTPNLVTTDLARATAFYRDVLGFSVVRAVPDEPPHVFVWLSRDEVTVFLNDAATVNNEMPAATTLVAGRSGVAMFITVEDIAGLWDRIRHQVSVLMPLKDQWYGMTEFAISDPDGYVITFAERRATPSGPEE